MIGNKTSLTFMSNVLGVIYIYPVIADYSPYLFDVVQAGRIVAAGPVPTRG